ncbi:MAG: hypothetical protein WAW73_07255 [Rhodoferax sp.]
MLTVLTVLLIAAISVVVLGVALLPVYLAVLWLDANRALQRSAELAEIKSLLAEADNTTLLRTAH